LHIALVIVYTDLIKH